MEILITGGTGFLGHYIAKLLQARGDKVRLFSRGKYPQLEQQGFICLQGDVRDYQSLKRAAQGSDAIIHTASKAGVWGEDEDYYTINVVGTANVIKVCQEVGISKLVYTSTPSVVHSGKDIEGADESLPYAQTFLTAYPKTKALAEQEVLRANSLQLQTVALRPHLIWGVGDNHLIPRIVERAKQNKLVLVNRSYLVDHVYVENAADAHCLALDCLMKNGVCAGKPYFISQGEPIAMNDLINLILQAADLPAVTRTISPKLLYAVGALMEYYYHLRHLKDEPPMTRFVAKQLSSSHWFNIKAAERDLGYKPKVSLQQGLEKLHQWFKQAK